MVFGSSKSSQIHWKQLPAIDSEEFIQSFREGLFKATGLDQDGWNKYWESMTDFRNKYAAHRELDFSDPVPDFDIALAVAHHYDGWVRRVISPASLSEPTLKSLELSLQKSFAPLAERLLEIT